VNFQFVHGGSPVAASTTDLQRMQIPAAARLNQPGSLGAFNLSTQQMKWDPSILDDNLSTLSGQITTNSNDIAALQGDVSTLQSNVSTLQGQVSTLQGEVATNTSNISTLQSDIGTINSTLTSLQNQINTINSRLAAAGIP
jgi:peptidoglycan hydrolase CwlO-like protein